jgi:hypothetical protein
MRKGLLTGTRVVVAIVGRRTRDGGTLVVMPFVVLTLQAKCERSTPKKRSDTKCVAESSAALL